MEGEGAGKAGFLYHVEGSLKIFLGLAGETHNDVRGDGRVRDFLPHLVKNGQELLGPIRPAHFLEHLVRTGLQRHVQLGAHGGGFRHGVDHVGGEFRWVRRRKPHPLQAGNLTASAQQPGESRAVPRQVGVRKVHTISVYVLPQQGNFHYALIDEGLHFGEDITRAAINFLAPQGRHNAEGAGVIAAHGHRHPAGVSGFPFGWQHRWELLQGVDDLHLGLVVMGGTLEQRRQRSNVMGAEHYINPRGLLHHGILVFLRQAPTDGDLHAGMPFLDAAERP